VTGTELALTFFTHIVAGLVVHGIIEFTKKIRIIEFTKKIRK
jgi:hypothetical protein